MDARLAAQAARSRPGASSRRGWWVPRREIPRPAYLGLALASVGVIVTGWSLVTGVGLIEPLFLPAPLHVLRAGAAMVGELGFTRDVAWTVWRVMAGFLLAAAIGVPLGVLVGTFRVVEAVTEPVISFIRYLPASAFIPLFILWLGLGEVEKVAVIFVGTFFQLVLMVAVEVGNVPKALIESAYTLGASHRQILTRVLLPASRPGIFDALRLLLGWAWTYIIVAELVGADKGIGFRILAAQRRVLTDHIIFGILTIGILGIATDYLLKWAHRRLFPWR